MRNHYAQTDTENQSYSELHFEYIYFSFIIYNTVRKAK